MQQLLQCELQSRLRSLNKGSFVNQMWLSKYFLIAIGIRNQVTPCKFRNGQS